jgi:hypothetical protein
VARKGRGHHKAEVPLLTAHEKRVYLGILLKERGSPEWEDPPRVKCNSIIQRIEYGQPLTAVERKQVSLALRRQWLGKLAANAYQRQLEFQSIEVLRHILKLRERVTGVRLNPADCDELVRKFHNRPTRVAVKRLVDREKLVERGRRREKQGR